MNTWFLVGFITLIIFMGMVAVFAMMFAKNLYAVRGDLKESKAGKVGFYDLASCGASSVSEMYEDETEEEYAQAVLELNEYIQKKQNGLNPVLSDKIRDRFIPITVKSVFALTFLQFVEVVITVGVLLAAFAVGGVILVLFG